MAIKQSATFRNTVPNGTYGTISKAEGIATFDGDAAGTEIHSLKLEAGTKVFGVVAHHDNLGAGTTIKVGFAYVDNQDGAAVSDAFIAAAATTAAGKLVFDGKPITLNAPAVLTVTNTGTATGSVVVIPEYEFRGV